MQQRVLVKAVMAVVVIHLFSTSDVLVMRSTAQSPDIVLYAADVSTMSGNWGRLASTSGAGGLKMTSEDRGASEMTPLAAPRDYFEAEFDAAAGVPYRVWLRLRAAGNSKWNESVWVQFTGAIDANGSDLWAVGTTAALLVNLEDCFACGVSGWGWQDNAWWLGASSVVRFRTTGRHRLRVQTREDGVDIDQIVLSAATFLHAPPGSIKDDGTIVPKTTPGTGAAATIVRGPYVQQVSDSSAVIVWTTREAGSGEVRYTSAAGGVVSARAETRLFPTWQTGLQFDFHQHEARLFGLSASTRYSYDVFVGGNDLTPGQYFFSTAPLAGTGTVSFIAFGDSGVGSPEQRQLAALMTADSFDLAIHGGDVAYGTAGGSGGGSYAQYDAWVFGVYGPWLRSRPFFPSIGNHDDQVAFAQPYRDVFVLPENGATAQYPDHAERYYSFDYGPVHFVALDTERAFLDPARRQAQLAWLDADLAATRQPWRVAYFHRPPYSASPAHGSSLDVRAAFAPLFEKHGVQLAIAAHDHDYERSTPWREFVTGGAAVTYIVAGGGGAPLYPAGAGPWTAVSASVHHYVRATASDCTLRIDAVRLDGVVFDSHTLSRCTSPAPAPTAPFTGAVALPGVIQAENFDNGPNGVAYYDTTAGNSHGALRDTDVDIERTTDEGGGYNLAGMAPGEWLTYSVTVPTAGVYTFDVRVAAIGHGARFHIEVNGVDKTGELIMPNTGAWQLWTTVTKTGVNLSAGPQTIKVVIDSIGSSGVVGNINYITVRSQ